MFVITYEGKYWSYERALTEDVGEARKYNQKVNAENARLRLLRGRPNFKADLMEVKEIPG